MKFNMGCGFNHLPGYVNVDKVPACDPDLLADLEQLPWPIETGEASEVVFNHSLEHLGQQPPLFLGMIKELYRICKPGARVHIIAPHPRHDHYIADPTHVRPITALGLLMFSKKQCLFWKERRLATSLLALLIDVDFDMAGNTRMLEEPYRSQYANGELSAEMIDALERERNNVIVENRFELVAVK